MQYWNECRSRLLFLRNCLNILGYKSKMLECLRNIEEIYAYVCGKLLYLHISKSKMLHLLKLHHGHD